MGRITLHGNQPVLFKAVGLHFVDILINLATDSNNGG